ncbi:MAG: hypothetical protein MK008_08845 [Bdellovibrionales bacterium]|nr:hypothetical protein [Bdellovibrionales bacterium]
MNKSFLALIFTFVTVSGTNLYAQFDQFGFSFKDSDQYSYYPVIVYNYKAQNWEDTSQSRVNQCLVGRGLYCPYVSESQSSEGYSLSLKLNPDGSIFTLPKIFEQYYELIPDYSFDDLKTSGLSITHRSDTVPGTNN